MLTRCDSFLMHDELATNCCITKHLKTQWLGATYLLSLTCLWSGCVSAALCCVQLGSFALYLLGTNRLARAHFSYGNDGDTRQQAETWEISYGPGMKPGTLSLLPISYWPEQVTYPNSKSGDMECILSPWWGHGQRIYEWKSKNWGQ